MSRADLPLNCPVRKPGGVCPDDELEPAAEKAVWRAIGDIQDEQTEMAGHLLSAEHIAAAVETGLIRAAGNPEVWIAASGALQAHAKREAGGWLLGSIGGALSKLLLVALVAMGVYLVGGWAALGKVWGALRG